MSVIRSRVPPHRAGELDVRVEGGARHRGRGGTRELLEATQVGFNMLIPTYSTNSDRFNITNLYLNSVACPKFEHSTPSLEFWNCVLNAEFKAAVGMLQKIKSTLLTLKINYHPNKLFYIEHKKSIM